MSARQERLFPAPQPLVDRLGAAFFRALPRDPGVYRMFDEGGVLLYVGKAKDLRARLDSYRRTTDQSRKTRRLIHAARRIEWVVCADETEARLLENQLIRTLRPRFNRAGTWPASARFLRLEHDAAVASLEIRVTPAPLPEEESYGAFRGGVSRVLAALARVAWFGTRGEVDLTSLPRPLLHERGVREWSWPSGVTEPWLNGLCRFLSGESDAWLGDLAERMPQPSTPFEAALLALDFERLTGFFRAGPWRNLALQRYLPPGTSTLAPEDRDDLWIRWSAEHPVNLPRLETSEAAGSNDSESP